MAIIPNSTQFRANTTGVPVVARGSKQTQERGSFFTMEDISQSVTLDPNADVYSNKLFTEVAEPSAKINSFSETSSSTVISYSSDSVDADGTGIEIRENITPIPVFVVGDQLTIFTNGSFAPVVIQLITIYISSTSILEADYNVISGTPTPNNYYRNFDFDLITFATVLNVDTDLTGSVSAGNSIILGGLSYVVNAITSTAITIDLANSAIANLAKIGSVDLEIDFSVLSYRATLTDGSIVQKTTLLGYNLIEDRTFLRGSIDFLGTSPTIANQFIGVNSGLNTTTGYYNTANGFDSMKSNTIGTNNSAFGYEALKNNGSGYNNCAFGSKALKDVTTGYGNVAVGSGALQTANGYENVAVGSSALGQTYNGYENVAIGHNSLNDNYNGYENVALGHNALKVNYNGYENIALGKDSLGDNYDGFENIGIGYNAGLSLRDSNNNTIIGNNAVSGGFRQNANKHSVFGSATNVAPNTDGSVVLGYGAESTLSNQFVVGSVGTVAGAVVNGPFGKVWNVVINGVAQQILLA